MEDGAAVSNLAGKNTDGDRITLYARWSPNRYTILLDPNGGEGEVRHIPALYGQAVSLGENTFIHEELEFAGWALTPQGEVRYPDLAQVKDLAAQADGEITLYAVWRTPVSQLQKPYLEQLDAAYRALGAQPGEMPRYTSQDWETLTDAYAAAVKQVEGADREDVMSRAAEEGIAAMQAVPTAQMRVEEVVSAWQAEHRPALELTQGSGLTEPDALQAAAQTAAALYDLEPERLAGYSGLTNQEDLAQVGSQAAVQLHSTAQRSSCRIELTNRPAAEFSDVKAGDWQFEPVQFTAVRGLFTGTGGGAFSPDAGMTRGMLVTVLHRLEGSATPGSSGTFQDVPGDAWYAQAADWAAEAGITAGTAAGRFEPQRAVTREMLALMLYRSAGSPALSGAETGLERFPDEDQVSPWARQAMAWACAVGVLNGDDQGRLLPQAGASRGETAVMLSRFMELTIM